MPGALEALNSALAGRYSVERELGQGGMATVYLARDLKHRRPVALKVLRPELAAALGPERFLREIEITAGLQHPHVLALLDSGEAGGFLFYVMPYVEGESLRQRLEREPQLPVDEAIRIACEVAGALEHAHQRGVVHRDIKPENVLMSGGHAMVADFGIARALGSAAGDALTQTGTVVGTSAYMSPEQAAGDGQLDGRSDVYSLACVLYEMLAGQPPFTGPTTENIVYQHLSVEPRSVAALRPSVPAGVSAAIGHALAKSVADRPRTAAGFAEELTAPDSTVAKGAGAGSGLLSRARQGGRLRWALGILAVAALATAGWWLRPRAPGVEAGSTAIAVMPFSVRGSDQYEYLGDGMADLLSAKLDGAGGLASVDPHAVFRLAGGEERGIDPERAADVATRLQARWFVLGSIVEAGGSLQVTASLYDRLADTVDPTTGRAEGAAEDVFALVDQVAAELLVGLSGGPEARVQRVAGVTTSSLPAFKAYMDGERAYRGGEYAASLDHFERAVELDSTFALAYYRISTAAEWAWDEAQIYAAAERAVELADRLPERERRLVQVLGVRRRETNERAEDVLLSVVGSYPNDMEAWANLGELLSHTRPMHGRSMLEGRRAWQAVLAIDSTHSGALLHMMRFDAYEGKLDSMDARLRRFHALNPQADRSIEMDVLAVATHADPDAEAAMLERLASASDLDRALGVWNAAVYAGNLDMAVRICEMMAATGRSLELRRAGYQWLAGLQYALGRWSLAERAVQDLASVDALAAAEFRAVFLAFPYAPVSPDELQAAASLLDVAVLPTEVGGPQMILNPHDGLHPMLRAYGLGVFSALRGDTAEAGRWADSLTAMRLPADHERVAQDLALGVRARTEMEAGRPEAALAHLEQMRMSAWHGQSLFSPFYARTTERFLRGEALLQVGRGDEALGWLTHIAENSPFEVAYVPASLLRRAEIQAARGDTAEALRLYDEFLRMWRDCDPALRPIVDAARERSEALRQG